MWVYIACYRHEANVALTIASSFKTTINIMTILSSKLLTAVQNGCQPISCYLWWASQMHRVNTKTVFVGMRRNKNLLYFSFGYRSGKRMSVSTTFFCIHTWRGLLKVLELITHDVKEKLWLLMRFSVTVLSTFILVRSCRFLTIIWLPCKTIDLGDILLSQRTILSW